jgi:ribosome-binding factor A
MSARKERVAHAIRETLTELIASDVKDPRVHAPTMLTVTRVELNVDMSVARCYVSIVADPGGANAPTTRMASEREARATVDEALAGLEKAAGFLRGPVARRVGLQRAPELRFFVDPSVDMSEKLAQIVRDDEDKARASGREPEKK